MTSKVDSRDKAKVSAAALSMERVTGFTHDYYNYPARFSPRLARDIINHFTSAGDLVLDPFMGGGTTLVESKLLNRNSIGFDISSLSTFLAKVKLNPLSVPRFELANAWVSCAIDNLNCHRQETRPEFWISQGYQRNLSNAKTWPIRKIIEQFLNELSKSGFDEPEQNFMRCVLLKTSQWALDSKKTVPKSAEFKAKIHENYDRMASGAKQFWDVRSTSNATVVNTSAIDIHKYKEIFVQKPKLVLTSPPYPGIHVVYHRWQVFGRKETPAPFWIANSQDGHGLAHYAMGDRKQKGLRTYFQNIGKSFESVRQVCDKKTLVIQVLAFSDLTWQLPKYLETMEQAGFKEVDSKTERIWRNVPNRKWYAQQKGSTQSSKEVILFHKLAR